jgi:hypothetical protein
MMDQKRWAGVLTLALSACGGSEKPANAPACPEGQIFDGRYCQMASTPAPSTGGSSAIPPPAPNPNPVPSALPVATADCKSPATPMDLSAAAVVANALTPLAAQKAMPGSKAVGAPLAGQFQQGQCLETTVSMSPGKCYSIVASALPTVQNLDLALVPNLGLPGLPQVVAAADSSTGATAVLGESPNCFKWALPTPGTMKLVMSVSAGQGVAAAQVFEK